jgi:carbamate kinase
MRVVIALGGNALLERGQKPDANIQEAHVVSAVGALAPLARSNKVLIMHGNGPQVGVLALESARDPDLSHPYPFDVLVAQTQGMIGYWLVQALNRALPDHPACCLLCRTVVWADDPAFAKPTKFVGPVYDEARARQIAAARGWAVAQDGRAWRRVVPSPEPIQLVETEMIAQLADTGTIVVCAGGGGVPVVRERSGALRGVEAVVDKDLTASLLGRVLAADALVILTDVDAVQDGYGTPQARPIHQTTPRELRARSFPAGSMAPKIEAACRFVEETGGMAAIGRLDDAEALLEGKAGTIITNDSRGQRKESR